MDLMVVVIPVATFGYYTVLRELTGILCVPQIPETITFTVDTSKATDTLLII